MPIFNAAIYLPEALHSLKSQTYRPVQVVFFDDCSTDDSVKIVEAWRDENSLLFQSLVISGSLDMNRGPGFARNEAIARSEGELIAHFDADDLMSPQRITEQVALYLENDRDQDLLIGSNFDRFPKESTPYYTTWLNNMDQQDLLLNKYRECTIICPSWMYSRSVFAKMVRIRSECSSSSASLKQNGGFVEASVASLAFYGVSRIPEDLLFFLDHLESGGRLAKVTSVLVTYRHSPGSWALGTTKQDLARIRASYIERMVIKAWQNFSIWGCGKDGRRFSNMLGAESASKLTCFLDVDPNKIGKSYYVKSVKKHVTIKHFSEGSSPMIICVGSKITGGRLEENIRTLNLREGVDYIHFS